MRSSNQDFSLRALALVAVIASLALASACGGGSGSKSSGGNTGNQVIAPVGPNAVQLVADQGPASLANLPQPFAYLNGSFVSVNVCVPGTSTCQTIDHLLVDTGSFGLRLLDTSSQGKFNSASFPAITDSSSNPIAECVQFLDGSFFWGRVALADVKFASPTTEAASSIPVHVIGDTTFDASHPVAADCASGGTDADTLASLGANGIIGVGSVQYDCGSGCAPGAKSTPGKAYYSCPSTGCASALVPLAQQVQNPVALFATDNNGVIVELPAPSSSGATTLTGTLVFGIGTQSNNALGSSSVLTLDDNLNFTTSYKGTSYPGSFVDSGSNAYFFLDPTTDGITQCSDNTSFYCPGSTQNLSATNQGQNSTSTSINFSVANADNLFNSSNVLFNNVGGPSGAPPNSFFDWGLPFFMGRNVFVSIAGKTAPGGTPPYVAY